MKTWIRLLVVIMMIMTSFYLWLENDEEKKPSEEKVEEKLPSEEDTVFEVRLHRSDGKEETIELETYLEGVVGSEMPASFEKEALKAQAVAARTFVAKRNFEVDDTTSSQVYQDASQLQQVWAESYDERRQRIHDVVQETKGEVMRYEGTVITASFFSSSCGKTANANEYWENDTPYLKSVDSHWDKEVNDGDVQTQEFDRTVFSQALGFQQSVSQISDPINYESGYVKEITIDGIIFSGREIREALQLRSSCFTLSQAEETITITTTGFGHGIGLSQYGAQGMAMEGYDYQDILHHYYQDIEIDMLRE